MGPRVRRAPGKTPGEAPLARGATSAPVVGCQALYFVHGRLIIAPPFLMNSGGSSASASRVPENHEGQVELGIVGHQALHVS